MFSLGSYFNIQNMEAFVVYPPDACMLFRKARTLALNVQ